MATKLNACFFCGRTDIFASENGFEDIPYSYKCLVCGHVKLTEEAADDFIGESFSKNNKLILSISHRNDYEKRKKKKQSKPYSIEDLNRLIDRYVILDPIDKMDRALLVLDKQSSSVAERIKIPILEDFTYYHCFNQSELHSLLTMLVEEGYIKAEDPLNPHNKLWISAKGYGKIRELKSVNQESDMCFVAIWFVKDMIRVYEKAIKPAIEFIEEGRTESRFKAIKIDNVEHINDINDEIIAAIRRSRFMVCDLTGYRGGIYFEAGFAYGLGLDIIYTCRKDWCKEHELKDQYGSVVKELFDEADKPVRIVKEGVHFDLAHRNRIEWDEDNLEEFKKKLQNRIKAVII